MRLPIADNAMREASPRRDVNLRNKWADDGAQRQPVNKRSAEIDGAEPSATRQVLDVRVLHTTEAVSINLQQP